MVRIQLGKPIESFLINRIGIQPANLHSNSARGSVRAVSDAARGLGGIIESVGTGVRNVAASAGAPVIGTVGTKITQLIAAPLQLAGAGLALIGGDTPKQVQPHLDTGIKFSGYQMASRPILFQGSNLKGAPSVEQF